MNPISKKAIIAIVVIVAVVIAGIYVLLPKAPAYAESIIIGTTDKVSDLDPASAYDFYTWEVFWNIGEGLMKYTPGTTDLEFGLAESMSISEDGTEYVFKLRSGLKFADGSPLNASVVKYCVDRNFVILGDPNWLVTSFVDRVEVVNETAVKFVLNGKYAYFPSLLATPPYFPFNPKGYPVDQIMSDATEGGCGPYKITSWVRDEVLVLEENPNYYGDKPKTKKVVVKFYKDATTMRLALEAEEIDVAWRTLRPIDIPSLKENPNLNITEVPGAYIRYIVFNVQADPFDDVLVRRALAAAVNRTDIAQTVFYGTVDPLYSMIPMGMWSHKDVFYDKYGEANVALARELLTQAGYSETNKAHVTLWYTPTHYGDTEVDVATVIKHAWENTGMVEVELKSAEWAEYLSMSRNAEQASKLFGWYPDYIDPDDYTTPFLHSAAHGWTGSLYENPTVNNLLEQAAVETSIEVRTTLYEEVQDIMADDVPIIPLFQGKLIVGALKNVKGVVIDPVMIFRYYLIYKEV